MESDFVNITKDGGVQKRILQAGQGDHPQTNSTCKIYYLGTLEDQKPFDSNIGQSQPSKHILKRGDRCKGFEIGLQSMKPGEKSQFKITPEYGYGGDGNIFKNVPKDAHLRYEIELVSFKLEKKKRWLMSPEEKHEEALKLRKKGTKLFKDQNYQIAKQKYKDALTYCALDTKEGKELEASLQLNLSICCYLKDEFKESIDHAKAALKINSNDQQNVKAYYRCAMAYLKIGEQEFALQNLQSAYKLDPQNIAVIEELQKVKQYLKLAYSKEKESWGKLFKDKDQDEQQLNQKPEEKQNDQSKDQITQISSNPLKPEVPENISKNVNEQQESVSEQTEENQQSQQEENIVTQASQQESEIESNINDLDKIVIQE
ncbi:unnamed protein product [Paramecium sonneborni]|uniref:peptidylprolyl isomerase n=1 Tax=Paramecium sonneborni TaxID=65129 RepID=A0A8S1R840_9CILI|nr:unnamed protein product [Paramecium sonneborni]